MKFCLDLSNIIRKWCEKMKSQKKQNYFYYFEWPHKTYYLAMISAFKFVSWYPRTPVHGWGFRVMAREESQVSRRLVYLYGGGGSHVKLGLLSYFWNTNDLILDPKGGPSQVSEGGLLFFLLSLLCRRPLDVFGESFCSDILRTNGIWKIEVLSHMLVCWSRFIVDIAPCPNR